MVHGTTKHAQKRVSLVWYGIYCGSTFVLSEIAALPYLAGYKRNIRNTICTHWDDRLIWYHHYHTIRLGLQCYVNAYYLIAIIWTMEIQLSIIVFFQNSHQTSLSDRVGKEVTYFIIYLHIFNLIFIITTNLCYLL